MTGPLWRFPDVQKVLVALLGPLVGGTEHVGPQTPGDLQQRLPFIRARRIGGPTTRVDDFARVELDVFHSTYASGERLAEDVRQFLLAGGLRSGRAVVDRVRCDSGPFEVEWAPDVRRFRAEYTFVSRRYLDDGS